jgi:hypothetical protein
VEVARGRVTVVCVRHGPDGSMKSAHLPAALAERLEPAPRELLG